MVKDVGARAQHRVDRRLLVVAEDRQVDRVTDLVRRDLLDQRLDRPLRDRAARRR